MANIKIFEKNKHLQYLRAYIKEFTFQCFFIHTFQKFLKFKIQLHDNEFLWDLFLIFKEILFCEPSKYK